MDKFTVFVIVAFILSGVFAANDCPPPSKVGTCASKCSADKDCNGRKCCNNPCNGMSCVTLGKSSNSGSANTKQLSVGSPITYCSAYPAPTLCTPVCKTDSDCAAIKGKCCPNSCKSRSCVQNQMPASKSTGYKDSSQSGVGSYCGGTKCNSYEKCQGNKCVRA